MSEQRKHPELLTADEAALYLRCDVATLDTYRRKGWLTGYQNGKSLVYYLPDLNDCALRIVGCVPMSKPKLKELKMA
jgi:hypothetical protein